MNTNTETLPAAPNFDAIKAKQRATWSSGDYSKIGSTLQLTGENLAETLALRPGSRVLDVAAGNGNITLAMARRFAKVTSTDYCDNLLARGAQRAAAEGLDVDFQNADAENLPFADGEFDSVVSTFGVQFAPNQTRVASELLRVCRSGGKIGLANWTPPSFIGGLFKTIAGHVAPPAGIKSPAMWGDRQWIQQHFGKQASDLAIERKHFDFLYPSPQYFLDFFRTYYGPVEKAFGNLEPDGQAALAADILSLIEQHNIATDGTMRVPSEYVELVVTKS